MSHRRQPKMRSRSGSTISPSSFTRSILFRFAKEISTRMQRNSLSVGQELRADQPFRIVVHLPEAQASIPEAHEIAAAITGYFGYRVRTIMLDLKELFRVGWRALAIGLIVLFLSVIIGQTVVANLAPRPIGRVIEESLLIFGWVANWRPIEIFLYEWWPIVRRRNLYQRLAAAQVDLKPYKSDKKRRSLASEC